MSNKKVCISGFTLFSAVFIVFLVLKLAEVGVVATWSWWWVFSPLWLPVALVAEIVFAVFVACLVSEIFKK